MRDYVLLTDSCCDLSAEMAAELGVEILPLSLEMGGKATATTRTDGTSAFRSLHPAPRWGAGHHLRRERGRI